MHAGLRACVRACIHVRPEEGPGDDAQLPKDDVEDTPLPNDELPDADPNPEGTQPPDDDLEDARLPNDELPDADPNPDEDMGDGRQPDVFRRSLDDEMGDQKRQRRK